MPKITLIGAGSVVFAKTLICDLLQKDSLRDSVICLMDIDARRLKTAEILAKRVVKQLSVKAKIQSTLDLKKACQGANYAITMIQVGGYDPGTVTDFEIPKKYGLRQTIADTLGIGGIFRGLRTIPELLKIARTIQDYGAPGAFLLNYSNPMAMNCMAIDKDCGLPHVGLCHSVQSTSRQLASYIQVPVADISFKVAGINHVAFFLEFNYGGQDAYPLLFAALDKPEVYALDKVRFEMMRRLGYFVTESSEHFSEYCPWFIHHGEKIINEFNIPLDEYIRRCQSIIATWQETEKKMLTDHEVDITKSYEYGSQIIDAMEGGSTEVIYGNVPNQGLITNLPLNCCVEVACLVDRNGLQPTHIGELPLPLAAMCRSNVSVQELTVEAALTQNRELIYQAAMMDPHTASQLTLDEIWRMCDELIDKHQKNGLLPQYSPTRANTGRSEASLSRVIAKIEPSTKASQTEDTLSCTLSVRNDTNKPLSGKINLDFDKKAFRSITGNSIAVKVPPSKTISKNLTFKRTKADNLLEVVPAFSSPGFLGIGYREQKRNRFILDSRKGLNFSIVWNANTVLEGTLKAVGQNLRLYGRVHDSDVKPSKAKFWLGSVIEIFTAAYSQSNSIPRQIALTPFRKGAKVVDRRYNLLPGEKLKIKVDKAGYDFDTMLSCKTLGITPGEAFLMEINVHVNALGDAHGKVKQSWQEAKSPHLSTAGFALITQQKK